MNNANKATVSYILTAHEMGYWAGYGYGLSGAPAPNFYCPTLALRAGISLNSVEEFGDGMFLDYQEAIK